MFVLHKEVYDVWPLKIVGVSRSASPKSDLVNQFVCTLEPSSLQVAYRQLSSLEIQGRRNSYKNALVFQRSSSDCSMVMLIAPLTCDQIV